MDDWSPSSKTKYFSPRQWLNVVQELYEDIQELRAQNEALSQRIAHFEKKEQEEIDLDKKLQKLTQKQSDIIYKQTQQSKLEEQYQKQMEQRYKEYLEKNKYLIYERGKF